jgi:glycosyltransferase involved in cell wall biosynthesis
MRIAAITGITVKAGGGFYQALNAILQMARLCKNRYDFLVFTSRAENIPYFEKIGIEAKLFQDGITDKWVALAVTGPLTRYIQLKLRIVGRLERALQKYKIDLAYFVTPSLRSLTLQRINYVTTIWDLCHRDTPEFPEVRDNINFLSREFGYSNTLAQALFVLGDSLALCDKISRRYGVDRERLIAMPFAPALFTDAVYSTAKDKVLEQYQLTEGYYFYPAQFWAHKNHVRIVQALKILKEKGKTPLVVFSGGDNGIIKHVKATALKLGVREQVQFIGFVPTEHIRGLYEGCRAVVVPSYFGPTNLPPLEAWKLRRPLLYSSHLGEQTGQAALLFNPDSAVELAKAMDDVTNIKVADSLVRQGIQHLAHVSKSREQAEQDMLSRLDLFSKRLECWS